MELRARPVPTRSPARSLPASSRPPAHLTGRRA
jgi:hypothetical protein